MLSSIVILIIVRFMPSSFFVILDIWNWDCMNTISRPQFFPLNHRRFEMNLCDLCAVVSFSSFCSADIWYFFIILPRVFAQWGQSSTRITVLLPSARVRACINFLSFLFCFACLYKNYKKVIFSLKLFLSREKICCLISWGLQTF